MVEYISNALVKTNEIKPIFYNNSDRVCGIIDKSNSIIYKNYIIGLSPGGAFNDFFNPNSESSDDRAYGLGRMVTQNVLACGDRFYTLTSDQNFSIDIIHGENYSNNYKKIFLTKKCYICRKYNEKGVASISYVYPNNSSKHHHELGEFVGETVRYTNSTKECSIYQKGITSEKL